MQSDRVGVPFISWVILGEVWKINGLWGNSGEESRLDGICELGSQLPNSQQASQFAKKVLYIKGLRISHTFPTRSRRKLLGLGMGAVYREGVGENSQRYCVNNLHFLRSVWNERFRRAIAESRGLCPEGLDKGFEANSGVPKQMLRRFACPPPVPPLWGSDFSLWPLVELLPIDRLFHGDRKLHSSRGFPRS